MSNVFHKTLIIDEIINGLKFNLDIHEDEDFKENWRFKKIVESIKPDNPIAEFENWYIYLFNLKTQLLDIIRSVTIYNDYLSKEFLHELIIIEKLLLMR